MALTTTPLPYGLRDVKLKTYTDLSALTLSATAIDLPNSRTFSFGSAADFEELRGDDQLVAIHGNDETVEWSLEGGGVSFEAVRAMYGGTITETGTTPAQKKVYSKAAFDARPYFKVEGQSISESGGDFHTVVYRCRATDNLEGEQGDGAFYLTGAGGRGLASNVPSDNFKVFDFIQNETTTAIAL